MDRALFILGYFWALPTTLAGVAVALLGFSRAEGVKGGAVLFCARSWLRALLRWGKVAAFTWGGCIVVAEEVFLSDESLLRHELRHFWQARILGPLIGPVYLACGLIAWAEGRDFYAGNALEVDARNHE